MKAILINFFLLTALLSLMSCSAGKQDVSLKVSAGFAIGSAGYTGGLIAYGENGKGERFSVSASEGQDVSVTLANGSWKIYVMGWESPTAAKFRGTKYCGLTNVNLASDTKDINVTIKPENCSSADFQDEASVQNLLISSCGAFYNYGAATNTFSPLTAANTDSFCSSLPSSLSYSLPYYKLVSTNIVGKAVTPGLSTECIPTTPAAGMRLSVPTQKYPWVVQMYRSLKDCQEVNGTSFERFAFPKGLAVGNQPSFDQHMMVNANNEGRLFLPSGKTRRGYSPFMNLLPRILCGTTDCFAAPEAPTMTTLPGEKADIDVRWNSFFNNDRTPILIKGFKTSKVDDSCDPNTLAFLSGSPYFNLNSCRIEEGNLRADFSRNAFTCRGTTDLNGTIDLYERDNKIYLVQQYYDAGTRYKVSVYSMKGSFLNEIQVDFVTGHTYKSMTVDQYGRVYVLLDTASSPNRILRRYEYDQVNNNYNQITPFPSDSFPVFNSAEKIESLDGDYMAIADVADLRVIHNTTPTIPGPALGLTTIYNKLQFKDGQLYVLNGVSGDIQVVSANYATLALTTATTISSPLTINSFHISSNGTQRTIYLHPSSSGNAKVYNLAANNTLGTMVAQHSVGSVGYSSLLKDGKVYSLRGSTISSAQLTAYKVEPATTSITLAKNPTDDICESQLTATIEATNYKLNLSSYNVQSIKMVFEEAFRNIGRRSVASEQSIHYFESLSSDGDDEQGRSEGTIRRGSEMMGPDGLGGILHGLYPNSTCSDIKALAGNTGITTSFTLKDREEMRTYALNISVPTTNMHEFVCPTGPCTTKYDLALEISAPNKEKMNLKVSCSQKIGSLESADQDDEGSEREMIIWNTEDEVTARYESYQIEDRTEFGMPKQRINISVLKKTASVNLVQRYLELNRSSSHIEGRVSETGVSAGKLYTTSLHTGNLPNAQFIFPNYNLSNGEQIGEIIRNDEIRDLDEFAKSCTSTTNTNPLGANDINCTLVYHAYNQTSLHPSLEFNLESLKDFTDGGASAPFYGLFTLQP